MLQTAQTCHEVFWNTFRRRREVMTTFIFVTKWKNSVEQTVTNRQLASISILTTCAYGIDIHN